MGVRFGALSLGGLFGEMLKLDFENDLASTVDAEFASTTGTISKFKSVIITSNWRNFHQHRAYIVEAMAQNGMEPIVIGPYSGEDIDKKLTVPVYKIAFKRTIFDTLSVLATLRDVAAIIRDQKPDLLNAITLKPIVIGSLLLRFGRLFGLDKKFVLVATFAGLGIVFSKTSQKSVAGRMRRFLVERLFRFLLQHERITGVFETTSDQKFAIEQFGIPVARTVVVDGTGVDLEVFQPGPRKTRTIKNILFAGRLLHSKGIFEFVKSAEILSHTGEYRFIVAGWEYDSPDALTRAELEALRSNPTVNYLGFVENMAELLRDVDLLVLPSQYPEGIPKILLEAAASEVPILTTDFPGSRMVVRDGFTGYIVPTSDPRKLSEAIQNVFFNKEKYDLVRRSSRKFILDNGLSSSAICHSFIKIFRDVVRES